MMFARYFYIKSLKLFDHAKYDRFLYFYFQFVEKFEHVQTFQLIEISFQFDENVNIFIIILHNLLISRNQNQLNGWCNVRYTQQYSTNFHLENSKLKELRNYN